MKFNFSVIQNPIVNSPVANCIQGTLPTGEKITVERRQVGWAVNLRITVNDFVWHDSEALFPERREFEELCSRTLDIRHKNFEAARENLCRSAEILLKA